MLLATEKTNSIGLLLLRVAFGCFMYANHKDGRKYDKQTGEELPREYDAEKSAAAAVFYEKYVRARENEKYRRMKQQHREEHEAE